MSVVVVTLRTAAVGRIFTDIGLIMVEGTLGHPVQRRLVFSISDSVHWQGSVSDAPHTHIIATLYQNQSTGLSRQFVKQWRL